MRYSENRNRIVMISIFFMFGMIASPINQAQEHKKIFPNMEVTNLYIDQSKELKSSSNESVEKNDSFSCAKKIKVEKIISQRWDYIANGKKESGLATVLLIVFDVFKAEGKTQPQLSFMAI